MGLHTSGISLKDEYIAFVSPDLNHSLGWDDFPCGFCQKHLNLTDINYSSLRQGITLGTSLGYTWFTILNNQWVKEEITREIRKYISTNKNKNATHKNFWDAVKSEFIWKFRAINAYIKKKPRRSFKMAKEDTEITFLPTNTSEIPTCGTTPTEHLLNAGRRPQTSQKARNSPTYLGGVKEKRKNRDKE